MANHHWIYVVQALFLLGFILTASAAPKSDLLRVLGPQGVNLWKLEKSQALPSSRSANGVGLFVQDSDALPGSQDNFDFRAQWFQQPLDHFSKTNHTFHQRFWVNSRHYKPGMGGPVIVLDGGETSGEDRLPFLDTGIVEILARSTGGVGVVLEHRYYGQTIPVSNFTTDSLRWLTNEQAAADSANFMAHVRFDDIDEDLTAPGTPWIYYGGSYAGARSAHMKILYPELVYGAIASSGVTHAAIENWEYMEVIRHAADAKCMAHLERAIYTIDVVLASRKFSHALKSLFGVGDLEHDVDFASLISGPLGSWQSKNWDPAIGSTAFDDFCTALLKPFGTHSSDKLPFGHSRRAVTLADGFSVDFTILNYARWIKKNVVSKCSKDSTIEQCFGTFDDTQYQKTSLDQDWRLWMFQVCTQWGYFTTTPPNQKQPRIISRLLTLEYESKICKQAFLPGKHFVVPPLPNITAVNALGDFGIAADRLAIIDGEVDPWRPDTPHSQYAEDRNDTILRPFKLIPNGVHHYDENGLPNLFEEPPEIRKIHGETIAFVLEWLKDWKPPKKTDTY